MQSDLFGMVIRDPFKGLSDLQLGDEKGTLNHMVHLTSLLVDGDSFKQWLTYFFTHMSQL